jgi:hypothetical protein
MMLMRIAGSVDRSPAIFGPSMKPSCCRPIMSEVFVVCLCSLVTIRMFPGSSFHSKYFHVRESLVRVLDLALRCVALRAISVSPDPRISDSVFTILRANISICFTRFKSRFFACCILSFIHFLSGYPRDMIGVNLFRARNVRLVRIVRPIYP